MSHLSPYLHPTNIDFPILSHPIMSMVATSAVCYLTLGNEHEIVNCICILAATQGNGTPLHPNSFQEKHSQVVLGLGQVHPKDVL